MKENMESEKLSVESENKIRKHTSNKHTANEIWQSLSFEIMMMIHGDENFIYFSASGKI
jgi:hypothetical protein